MAALILAGQILAGQARADAPASTAKDEAKQASVQAGALAEVRVVTAALAPVSAQVVLTGDIQAKFLSNIAFRVSGKIQERLVEVGEHVTADQVLARLEPQEQQVNVDTAQAALASAEALLTQAKVGFERQQSLMRSGYTTRTAYDQAEQTLRTTQASVESAKAALGNAREQFSYTELKTGVAGMITARNAEAGQVVQSGQTVFTLAQDGPRDAVFIVSETLLAEPPEGKTVDIILLSDPRVRTTGTVREISPAVDPSSGGVRVKIGLSQVPPEMSLGATVAGLGRFRARQAISLPWSALFRWQDQPAVWVLDPGSGTVAPKTVTIDRYAGSAIVLSEGIQPGERVVTAGIQLLRPGQAVAVVGEDKQ
ncbi:acriflavin resistance protein [Methylobacterium indicum]|uniref:Acriflavin resistance protein n=1 Tax=Methylobacterium indicum TaxID=1775910 RepID=A0ABR5HHQ8_9HYPH|nr:efflux RND transporter periplasmic adaptor subunit [Methylobacterium indicum]KMO15500.1 acriflavin resistance protein [Methylobacterium indicum]KMO26191.1 acriflavin resistance protein [Methylobacterium indicum]KTS36232.1 acriflavin resistance protein [Methylobacterium indicum]KTS45478.1 acriflavin resistance protein [Methylobacterium indicum]